MTDPEIKPPETPWKPLLAVGVAAAGTSMLFPAAGIMGIMPVADLAAASIIIPLMGLIGGVTGWYTYKKVSSVKKSEQDAPMGNITVRESAGVSLDLPGTTRNPNWTEYEQQRERNLASPER